MALFFFFKVNLLHFSLSQENQINIIANVEIHCRKQHFLFNHYGNANFKINTMSNLPLDVYLHLDWCPQPRTEFHFVYDICYGTPQAVGPVFYMASMLLFHNRANLHHPTKDTISVLLIKNFFLLSSRGYKGGKSPVECQSRRGTGGGQRGSMQTSA